MQLQTQFPKHLSDRFPTRSHRRAALGATVLSIGLVLYGCGESKISQCNKVVTIANKTTALAIPKDLVQKFKRSQFKMQSLKNYRHNY
jgi:hypothetical protein